MPTVSPANRLSGLRERVTGWFRREPKMVVPKTILVVDSNASNRSSVGRMLESLGYSPLYATGLASALKQLEEQDPEFVLLAFSLDDLGDSGGLEALRRIRELDPELPVVMLAADLWDSRVAEAMRHGAIAYLPRPFGPDDLRELFGRSSR